MSTPGYTFVATPNPDTSPPSVSLTIADASVSSSTVMVMRLGPDGVWTPVRAAEPAQMASGGTWAGDDYEAPYGVPVRYLYRRPNGTVAGSVTETPDGEGTNELTLDVDRVWLIHPISVARSVPIQVRSWMQVGQDANVGLFQAVGGGPMIAVSGPRGPQTFELEVGTTTGSQSARLREILADGSPLLLNVPATLGWDEDPVWVSVGQWTRRRLLNWGADPKRVWALPCTEVVRPRGTAESLWSNDALGAEQPTYDAIGVAYESYFALDAHRRR